MSKSILEITGILALKATLDRMAGKADIVDVDIEQSKPLFIAPIRLLPTDELFLDWYTKTLMKVVRDGAVIWKKKDDTPKIIDAEFE